MTKNLRSVILPCALAVLACATLSSDLVQARGIYRRYPPAEWNRGRWVHDRHGGRLGWWWVIGNSWVYYPRPHSFIAPPTTVVIQPAPVMPPPAVVVQAPPPPVVVPPPAPIAAAPAQPVLYYCPATGTHYPETMTCPGGWSTMTAETPPQPMQEPAPAAVPAGAPPVTQ